ncbi:hypothetical protein LWI28_012505 [Acer negundo]|uniref:Cucumisin n=1 Tax=Acer negundo TaxID=4023 RepID=A0AAD5I9B9_ACENE|nr:hypothetical protein LWI28_012505 [Acer negundo]
MGGLPDPEAQLSVSSLHTTMLQQVVGSGASDHLLHSYKRSFNGFVAKLTQEEAQRLEGMEGVVSVFPSEMKQIQTTRSWDFMGFSQHVVRRATSESNVIIGMIDTGIWPESQSFSDQHFGSPPSTWKGSCQISSNFTCNKYCSLGTLDRNLVEGKIVVCDFQTDVTEAIVAGASGTILQGDDFRDVAYNTPIAASYLTLHDGSEVETYLNSTRRPRGTILKTIVEKNELAPSVAFFSSRGPNAITTLPMTAKNNIEQEFAYGSGHLNPGKAINPGLVYDAGEIDYVKFLCGQGYSTKNLRVITGDNFSCSKANNGSVWDLNLPSFTLSTNPGISTTITRIFHRRVTNVGSPGSIYKAIIVKNLPGIEIQVVPRALSFRFSGETKSFTVIVTANLAKSNNKMIVSASLIWDDGVHQCRAADPKQVYIVFVDASVKSSEDTNLEFLQQVLENR